MNFLQENKNKNDSIRITNMVEKKSSLRCSHIIVKVVHEASVSLQWML